MDSGVLGLYPFTLKGKMIQQLISVITNMFTWWVTVAPWEQAIRVRCGKHVRLLESGMYLRIPIIDRIYRQSTRRRLHVISQQTVTCLDGKTITLASMLGYTIQDMRKLYNTIQSVDTLEASAVSLTASYVSTNKFEDCNPSKIEAFVKSKIDLDKYGLSNTEFYISNFAVVRTIRIMTGEPRQWTGDTLDMKEGVAKP